eukprot:Ihof_evm2s335 gene=Ihof_evmTU2s335
MTDIRQEEEKEEVPEVVIETSHDMNLKRKNLWGQRIKRWLTDGRATGVTPLITGRLTKILGVFFTVWCCIAPPLLGSSLFVAGMVLPLSLGNMIVISASVAAGSASGNIGVGASVLIFCLMVSSGLNVGPFANLTRLANLGMALISLFMFCAAAPLVINGLSNTIPVSALEDMLHHPNPELLSKLSAMLPNEAIELSLAAVKEWAFLNGTEPITAKIPIHSGMFNTGTLHLSINQTTADFTIKGGIWLSKSIWTGKPVHMGLDLFGFAMMSVAFFCLRNLLPPFRLASDLISRAYSGSIGAMANLLDEVWSDLGRLTDENTTMGRASIESSHGDAPIEMLQPLQAINQKLAQIQPIVVMASTEPPIIRGRSLFSKSSLPYDQVRIGIQGLSVHVRNLSQNVEHLRSFIRKGPINNDNNEPIVENMEPCDRTESLLEWANTIYSKGGVLFKGGKEVVEKCALVVSHSGSAWNEDRVKLERAGLELSEAMESLRTTFKQTGRILRNEMILKHESPTDMDNLVLFQSLYFELAQATVFQPLKMGLACQAMVDAQLIRSPLHMLDNMYQWVRIPLFIMSRLLSNLILLLTPWTWEWNGRHSWYRSRDVKYCMGYVVGFSSFLMAGCYWSEYAYAVITKEIIGPISDHEIDSNFWIWSAVGFYASYKRTIQGTFGVGILALSGSMIGGLDAYVGLTVVGRNEWGLVFWLNTTLGLLMLFTVNPANPLMGNHPSWGYLEMAVGTAANLVAFNGYDNRLPPLELFIDRISGVSIGILYSLILTVIFSSSANREVPKEVAQAEELCTEAVNMILECYVKGGDIEEVQRQSKKKLTIANDHLIEANNLQRESNVLVEIPLYGIHPTVVKSYQGALARYARCRNLVETISYIANLQYGDYEVPQAEEKDGIDLRMVDVEDIDDKEGNHLHTLPVRMGLGALMDLMGTKKSLIIPALSVNAPQTIRHNFFSLLEDVNDLSSQLSDLSNYSSFPFLDKFKDARISAQTGTPTNSPYSGRPDYVYEKLDKMLNDINRKRLLLSQWRD